MIRYLNMNEFQEYSLKRDEETANQINSVLRKQNLSNQISLLQQQKEILAHLYQNASAFTNIIIIAGYVSILGTWKLMHEYFDKTVSMRIALMFSLSLFIFVFYEVYKMISQSLFFKRLHRIVQTKFADQERFKAWNIAVTNYSVKQSRIWYFILLPTVLSGFGAAVICIYQFIVNL